MFQQAESPGKRHLKAQEDREADRWGQEREQLRNRGGFLRKMGTKGALCRAKSSFMPFKAQNQRNWSALQADSPCLLLCLKKVPPTSSKGATCTGAQQQHWGRLEH